MSENVILIVGIVIFAITVYGSIMAGGTVLGRAESERNQDPLPGADEA